MLRRVHGDSRRYLPWPVPGTAIQVASLSDPESPIEVDVMALVP